MGTFLRSIQLVNFGIVKNDNRIHEKHLFERFPELRNQNFFLAYGHVVPRKGLEFLLAAWAESQSCHPRTILVIAGSTQKDPHYVSELKRKINESGLNKTVLLTGFVSSSEETESF